MLKEDKILVTGAGGFIGGWLVETLLLNQEMAVRAGIHNWSGIARLARFPHVNFALCDILDYDEISNALDGITCVVHCAKGSDESILQGTRNMLEGSFRQGIKHFVFVSTAEVYGHQSGKIDEKTSYQKTGIPYTDNKIEAEKICWEYQAKGLPISVVRPSIVYGPFSKTWTVNIAQKLQSGNWGLFKGYGDGICNLIYISDLVTAILLMINNERAAGQAFNVHGPDLITWNQYFQRFNNTLGLPELKAIEQNTAHLQAKVTEPFRGLAKFAQDHFENTIRQVAAKSSLARGILKFVEIRLKTSPRLTDFSLFNRKAVYTSLKAQEILGFIPRFDLENGLRLTIPWLRQLGHIN